MFSEENLIGAFFTLSGMTTAFHLLPKIASSKVKFWRLILDTFNSRQDQTFPLFAASMLVIVTVFPFLSNAPFWKHSTLGEMENCRANWRYNVLAAHNYVNRDKMCMEPTWIFSAELHLIIFALILLMLVMKFPKYSKIFFGISLVASICVVAGNIYMKKLHPFAILTPE